MNALLSITALTLVGLLSAPRAASAAPWQPIGPWGVKTHGFTTAPSMPSRIYLWAEGQWRSDDRGESWFPIMTGCLECGEIEVSPTDADLALAESPSGVHRTTDAGATWTASGAGLPGVYTLHFLAYEPGTVLAGTPAGVYASTDAGETWTVRAEGVSIGSFATSPVHPSVVVGLSAGWMLRSTDSGVTWTAVPPAASPGCGLPMLTLRWSLSDPNRIFAVGKGVARSDDAGLTFETLPTPSGEYGPFCDTESVDTHPTDPDRVIVGATEYASGGTFWIRTHHAFLSTDAGSSWSVVFDENAGVFPWQNDGGGVAMDRFDPDVTYVGMSHAHGIGFWRSDDPGNTVWSTKTEGIGGQEVTFLEVDSIGDLFARSNVGTGLWTAAPPYTSWSELPAIFPATFAFQVVTSLQVSYARTPRRLLETGYEIDIDVVAYNYESFLDVGGTWTHVSQGAGAGTLASNYYDGSVAYLWDSPWEYGTKGDLYRSVDPTLQSWNFVGSSVSIPIQALIASTDSDVVYAIHSTATDHVQVTTDGGSSWEARATGLPIERPIKLLMEPDDHEHLLVGYDDRAPWESSDGGKTWTEVAADPGGARVHDLAWEPSTGRAFLATDAGVLDEAMGWLGGLPSDNVYRIAYSEANNSLFVAPWGLSVWRLPLGGVVAAPVEPVASTTALSIVARPTPFTTKLTIEFELPRPLETRVSVYDVTGREVVMLRDGRAAPGLHTVGWDGRSAAGRSVGPGVYFVRVRAGSMEASHKIVKLRGR